MVNLKCIMQLEIMGVHDERATLQWLMNSKDIIHKWAFSLHTHKYKSIIMNNE